MHSASLITPVILAAGDSVRMGYPKALLPIGQDTFITRILKVSLDAGLTEPVIVLGRAAPRILPFIMDWRAGVFVNPDPDRGQLSSIQIGLSNVSQGSRAAMIWPVDQPDVSVELVRRLVEEFVRSESRLVFPKYGNKRGHPAIFHRSLFHEFMEAPLEQGAKLIVLRHQEEIAEVPTGESGSVDDIDTPSEYEELTGEKLDSALRNRNA